MNLLYFSRKNWRHDWRNLKDVFFKNLGRIWLPVTISTSYFPHTLEWFPWWVLTPISALLTLWECRPVRFIKYKLKDRDIWVEIRIGNIFDVSGSLVIGTNSTFETSVSDGTIAPDSLQGQCTKKYYDKEEYLDHDLKMALQDQKENVINDNGKKTRYSIGTVAKIQSKSSRTLYFVAIADINENKTAQGSREGVVESLKRLWHFIGERGEMEPLAVPVLGTGRTRIHVTREDMIRDIISSFTAACSENEKKFCEKLTIVISRNDYHEHEIDLQKLGRYLRHYCQYMSLKSKEDVGAGNAVPS